MLRPDRPLREWMLLAQTKTFDNLAIPIWVAAIQVVQQPAAPIDHHDQPAARSMILCVGSKVGGEVVDALAQQRDLHFGRTSVPRMRSVLFDQSEFGFAQLRPPPEASWPCSYLCSSSTYLR
jgi:hypothetical protein